MIDDVFAVIADPTRRQLLRSLSAGRRSVGELVDELGISQPTVSKHLKVLRESGLAQTEAQGQRRYYSLTPEPLQKVSLWIDALYTAFSGAKGFLENEDTSDEVEDAAQHLDSAEPQKPEKHAVTFTPLKPFIPSEPGQASDTEKAEEQAEEVSEPELGPSDEQPVQEQEIPPALPTAIYNQETENESKGLFATLSRWGRRRR